MTHAAPQPRGRPRSIEKHEKRLLIETLIAHAGTEAAAGAVGLAWKTVSGHRRRMLADDPEYFARLPRLDDTADRTVLRKAIIAQAKQRAAPRPNRRRP